jgi:hypothetical protein
MIRRECGWAGWQRCLLQENTDPTTGNTFSVLVNTVECLLGCRINLSNGQFLAFLANICLKLRCFLISTPIGVDPVFFLVGCVQSFFPAGSAEPESSSQWSSFSTRTGPCADLLSALSPVNTGAADRGALPSAPLRRNSRGASALDAQLARAGASGGPRIASGSEDPVPLIFTVAALAKRRTGSQERRTPWTSTSRIWDSRRRCRRRSSPQKMPRPQGAIGTWRR